MSHQNERPDVGSSISIVFAPAFNAVVIGLSKTERIYKFPCGKVEWLDIPGPMSPEFISLAEQLYGDNNHEDVVQKVADGIELDWRDSQETNELSVAYAGFLNAVARNCALRELEWESGIVAEELFHFGKLEYTRPIYKRGKLLRQFTFFGILKQQGELGHNCVENAEMADPEYWDPIDVLRWDVTQDKKLNPFHRIAFAKCLVELRDGGVAEAFPEFAKLLKRAEDEGFNIDDYEQMMRKKISAREI